MAEENNMVEDKKNTSELPVNIKDDGKKHSPTVTRFYKFLSVVWTVAELAGFKVTSRIECVDIKTGRVFK